MRAYLWALVCLMCAAASLAGASCGGEAGERTGAAGGSGAAGAGPSGAGGTTTGVAGRGGATAGTIGGAGRGGQGGAVVPGNGANLFATLLGKSQTDIDNKLTTAVNRFFGIGTSEPTTPTADTGYRCYYELPQDASMAFIWAADSDDVRSEGMSYGMMIAVQMNLQAQFDKLWKFARTYMQIPGNSSTSAWRYYFRWQGTVSRGSASNWTVNFPGTTGPAPDGDEYFAAALYLAHRRWGSTGAVNYKQEADNVSAAMLHNTSTTDGRGPIIHPSQNMVVFYPQGASGMFTDPSYHLPAFYELFAAAGPSADSSKWRSVAATSRSFLVSSAHGTTGLHPDYASFAGAPMTAMAGDGHNDFGYDAWRVVMNMAVDHAWAASDSSDSSDSRMKAQIEKYHAFFSGYISTGNVTQSLFTVSGGSASGGGSTALTATLAAGSLASAHSNRTRFVENLWLVQQQSGLYRYYQECVYLLGLLNAGGRFAQTF